MARGAPDTRLETRTNRLRLAPRHEPYWRTLTPGLALGYRRTRAGGTWIARAYDREAQRRSYGALGAADDHAEADGAAVVTFWQAQERTRAWWTRRLRAAAAAAGEGDAGAGPYTNRGRRDARLAGRLPPGPDPRRRPGAGGD